MEPRGDSPAVRARFAAAAIVSLTALALWLRLRALPGTWGTDSLNYVEVIRGGLGGRPGDPRAHRFLFMRLVEAALDAGGGRPAWASVPSVLFATATVPALWLALRRRLGDVLALLPAALWTFLGLDFEQTSQVSSDAALPVFVVAALGGILAAGRRAEGPLLPLALAGAAAGLGVVLKETMLFATAGLAVAAFLAVPGAGRWGRAAWFCVGLAPVALAGLFLDGAGRAGVISANTATYDWVVHPGDATFVRRLTIGLPASFVTATQAFGLLFVVLLPALVRLPFRAARGDPLAAAAVVAFLAFAVGPTSLASWALLPANVCRYFLCLVPLLVAACADALRDPEMPAPERAASLFAAAGGLLFLGPSPWTKVLLPIGLLLVAWPALPEAPRRLLDERNRLGVAAAVLLASTVMWRDLVGPVTSAEWAATALAGVLVTAPWLVRRDPGGPAPYLAISAAIVLALAMTLWRFVPDPGWTAWRQLPAKGRVFADLLVARRLRVAATAAGADASRIAALDPGAPAPSALGPDDRVLAREDTPLGRACADDPGFVRVAAELGEAAMFAPLRR